MAASAAAVAVPRVEGHAVTDHDRFRLVFGPYQTPAFKDGQFVHCELRGSVIVRGLTSGPIPWPLGKRRPGARARFRIVTAGLVEALRREPAVAVAYLTQARRALAVPLSNEGTHRLRHDYAGEPGVR